MFITLGFVGMVEIMIFDFSVFILVGGEVGFVDVVRFCNEEGLFIDLFGLYGLCGLISLKFFLVMSIGILVFFGMFFVFD